MADTTSKKSNHITDVITQTNVLLDCLKEFYDLWLEAGDLGYREVATGLQDADFVGDNGFLTAANYQDIFAAMELIYTYGVTGSPSPLKRLRVARR